MDQKPERQDINIFQRFLGALLWIKPLEATAVVTVHDFPRGFSFSWTNTARARGHWVLDLTNSMGDVIWQKTYQGYESDSAARTAALTDARDLVEIADAIYHHRERPEVDFS